MSVLLKLARIFIKAARKDEEYELEYIMKSDTGRNVYWHRQLKLYMIAEGEK